MKKLIALAGVLALCLVLKSQSTYNTQFKHNDTVRVTKNGNILGSAIGAVNDSAMRMVITVYQSVPPAPSVDSIKIASTSELTGTGALTHTVSAPGNSFIIIATGFEGNGKSCTVTATGLNFSRAGDAQAANSGDAEIFSAQVATAGQYTITSSWGGGFQTSVAYVVTGAEKLGATAVGTTQAAPSVNITTTAAKSLLIGVTSDYNGRDGSSRQYRDNAVDVFYSRASDKSGTNYHFYKVANTVKQYTEGLTSPNNMAGGTVLLELTGRSGPVVPDTDPPTAPVLSTSSVGSSSVGLTWSSSTDNVGVAGYDIYQDGSLVTTTVASSYTVSNLSASTRYTFYVEARDATGNKAKSNTLVVTTSSTPPPVDIASIMGFGADAVGGSNSSNVYHVTNTNSSGNGSLMNGIGSNKTIVFDVSGTINARHDITNVSYLTIDGTTAPYPGITISTKEADGMSIGQGSHHIIVKGLMFYHCYNDGLNVVDNAHDVAITNCTAYGNGDGNIDLAATSGQNVTMQYCIIGSHDQNQQPGNQGTGGTLVTMKFASLHHNLFDVESPAEGERCPFVHCNYSPVADPNADIVNNLVWNYGRSNATGSGYGSGIGYGAHANIDSNYYKTKSSTAAADGIDLAIDNQQGYAYSNGNVSGNGYNFNTGRYTNHARYPIPTKYQVKAQDACTAARTVLDKAGLTQRNANGDRVPGEQQFVAGIADNLTGCTVKGYPHDYVPPHHK